ncbi:hypothetical protein TNCV_1057181 [Trichonephila clavipes]|nr:hypothetical protein TNCV_1057181 [Trichonephila clavipes]
MRHIARYMGISDKSVRRIAKTELGMKPYKLRKFQLLTEKTNSYGSENVGIFSDGLQVIAGRDSFSLM